MNDIAITWLLGLKLVIVVGCRQQIEQRLRQQQQQQKATAAAASAAAGDDSVEQHTHGLRVTDGPTLRIVKEEAGYVRFEVERQLARSLRMQGGGGTEARGRNDGGSNNAAANTKSGYYAGNVVSGNFYSAQPFGILDGLNYQYTGFGKIGNTLVCVILCCCFHKRMLLSHTERFHFSHLH